MNRMTQEKREEWEAALNDPLPDSKPQKVSPRVAEQEGDLFMAAMAQTSRQKAG